MSNYVMFDPANASRLAKFQGTLAGTMAANAAVTGTGTAAAEIYNQGGYYALQDTDTGYVSLQKLGTESLYSNEWYSQSLGGSFDFSNNQASVFTDSDLSNSMSADEIAALNN